MRSILFTLFFTIAFFTNCQKTALPTPPSTIPPVEEPQSNDFWQKENPSKHGFSESAIAEIIKEAESLDNFYALLIVRNQKLLVEEYFENHTKDSPFELRSITKNITSALTGIAIEKQWLPSVTEPIHSYFPKLNLTDDKKKITFQHLLNMSSGLTWDEDNKVLDLVQQKIPQPVNFILAQPLANQPNAVFNYNSISPHVVAKVLTDQSGLSLLDLAQKEIFDPLDIQPAAWTTDPEGANWGGFGLQLTARDLAKFGQLYLNEGLWEGTQIIPADWVKQSSQTQIFTENAGYSNQWWVSTKSETTIYYGQGFGGQGLILLPEKDLIIIALQEAWIPPSESSQQWRDFINKVFNPILENLDK